MYKLHPIIKTVHMGISGFVLAADLDTRSAGFRAVGGGQYLPVGVTIQLK